MLERGVSFVLLAPPLADLEPIADYSAIENPAAAGAFIWRVLAHVDKLEHRPLLGPVPLDLQDSCYREVVELPCRIFYRLETAANNFLV
jgi:plasmid stabilization system protein ParE